MIPDQLLFILIIVVTLQPIAYGLTTFYFMNKMQQRLESFSMLLQQGVVDKAGLLDTISDTESSLDYQSREIAKMNEVYAKVSFLHTWVNRLDATITLLNLNITEAIDMLKKLSKND